MILFITITQGEGFRMYSNNMGAMFRILNIPLGTSSTLDKALWKLEALEVPGFIGIVKGFIKGKVNTKFVSEILVYRNARAFYK